MERRAKFSSLKTLLCLLLFSQFALSDAPPKWSEQHDRNVDRAALHAKESAISQFEALEAKYKGTESESPILTKLMEAQAEAGEYEFRIAQGDGVLKHRAVDLSRYNERLNSVIRTATVLIKKFPALEEIERIYFFRARSYDELKDSPSARREYNYVADHYPKTKWAIRSNMKLADFAIEDKDQNLAIKYLKRVEEEPDDSHYSIALYELAWCYFNLDDFGNAMSYIKRNISFYQARKKASEVSEEAEEFSASDNALMEHSFRDFVTFYFEGYDKGNSAYPLNKALKTFRSLEPDQYLGRMMIVFGELLRSREHSVALNEWRKEALAEELTRPETLDVIMLNYGYVLEKRSYDQLAELSKDFPLIDSKTSHHMRQYESYPKAQKIILDSAIELQKQIAGQPTKVRAIGLSRVLGAIYQAFTAIVDDSDPRVNEAHYNLAEIWFGLQDYAAATTEYKWVIDHWRQGGHLILSEVRLKALSSKYRDLKAKKLLPPDLKVAKLNGSTQPSWKDLDKDTAQWIEWVDAYLGDFGRKPTSAIDFEYESDRILYSNGQTRPSVKRMMKLVKAAPNSTAAFPAANLVLDTYLVSEDWEDALEAAELFLALPNFGTPEFRARLTRLPGDLAYKNLVDKFNAKKFDEAIVLTQKYLIRYPTAEHVADCLLVGSRAAMELKQPDKALFFSSEMLKRPATESQRSSAFLTRAGLEESSYDFDSAQRDYAAYLALPLGKDDSEKERKEITKHFFLVSWLALAPTKLTCRSYQKDEDLSLECDRYDALITLQSETPDLHGSELVEKITHGVKVNRPLWAAVALKKTTLLGFKDRLLAAELLAKGWSEQDALIQFSLIPAVNKFLPAVFASAQQAIPGMVHLKVSSTALKHRVELIQAVETSAGKAISLPWAQVKISLLTSIAKMYFDFCDDLGKLAPPEGLSPEEMANYKKQIADLLGPFHEKGKTLQGQAEKMALESPIDPKMAGIVAKKDRKPAMVFQPLDLTLLDSLLGDATLLKPNPLEKNLRTKWTQGIEARAWPRVAFFSQEYKEKLKPADSVVTGMRAIALDYEGAQPESIGQLEILKSELTPDKRTLVNRILYSLYFRSSSAQKAEAIDQELKDEEAKRSVSEMKDKKQ
jgi:outer membrane protein assembly factor BamD (BamD/ComL family)